MGRRAPGGAAPLSALSLWRARRALAHAVDEPHQSGPVRGRLHGLGAGVLAGPPRVRAIDGKTSRRSHDRATGTPPLHLVSAVATTARLVLGQEAVPDKASETTAIPALIERLAEDDGLKGALVSIDAVATNAAIAGTIRGAGADYLLAVKANQPTLRSEVEALFAAAEPAALDRATDLDKGHGRIQGAWAHPRGMGASKGHGRIEERTITVAREVDWLEGARRFPG